MFGRGEVEAVIPFYVKPAIPGMAGFCCFTSINS